MERITNDKRNRHSRTLVMGNKANIMRQTIFLTTISVVGFLVVLDGCDVNPFSPPDRAKPSESSSSSSSASGTGGMAGNGSSSSSSGMGGSGGISGAGGAGGGTAGAGGGCVCTDDQNVCTDDIAGACPDGNPAACHSIKFAAVCPAGRCDDKGACVDCLACTDAACVDRCNGLTCAVTPDCKSGHCEQMKCCNAACAGPCTACDRTGQEGTCVRSPLGLQVPGCTGAMICGSDGSCMAKTKAPLGALCGTSTDCQSGLCRREYCQSPIGEPCVENLECGTSLCDPASHTCKSCTGGGTCPGGLGCDMATGFCQVPLGQPAKADAECLAGTVLQFLCSLPSGAACQAHDECIGRNCVGGVCKGSSPLTPQGAMPLDPCIGSSAMRSNQKGPY